MVVFIGTAGHGSLLINSELGSWTLTLPAWPRSHPQGSGVVIEWTKLWIQVANKNEVFSWERRHLTLEIAWEGRTSWRELAVALLLLGLIRMPPGRFSPQRWSEHLQPSSGPGVGPGLAWGITYPSRPEGLGVPRQWWWGGGLEHFAQPAATEAWPWIRKRMDAASHRYLGLYSSRQTKVKFFF